MPDPQRSDPAFEATILSSSQPAVAADPEGIDALLNTRLRHFEVQKLLGRGGMGAVYLGWDTSLERPVALKVLDAEIGRDPELLARFTREARAQARLRHPNVTQIYFIGEDRGINFFAMEYVEGRPLDRALADGERVPWPDAVEYVIAAARGLRAAYQQGFIHRDVKPSNLLLDNDGQVKIADFGLAKSLKGDVELTREGVIVGSPLYMAPEQGRAESVDHRSDIYSLGCAFYHLLTGRPPFSAPTPVGVITRHVTDRPVPITKLATDVPERVERLVDRMMAKEPAGRPASYDELLAALDAVRPGRQEHSGFWARGMALLIDATLLGLCGIFLHNWALLLAVVYFGAGSLWRGQTVGKWLLRLRVTDLGGNPVGWRRALIRLLAFSWGPLIWVLLGALLYYVYRDRYIAFQPGKLTADQLVGPIIWGIVFTITLLGYVAGFLVAAFHPKKRALHDLLAGTCVTYTLRS
jgi:uncharacterized RDD family membrane protein YckC/predicted Ser/Thr protein kinase